MKKFVVALIAGLLLVGCTPTQSAPVANPTVTITAMPMDDDSRFDQAFVGQYEVKIGGTPSVAQVQSAREVGRQTCAALKSGVSADQVAMIILKNTTTESRPVVIIAVGVGVGIYCPEFISSFK